jgi:hypothetical protein
MKYLSLLLVASQLTFSINAYCDDMSYMTPLNKGTPAPYAGVLLSPPAIASIIADKEAVPETIKIETDKARAEEQAASQFKVSEVEDKAKTDKAILQTQVNDMLKQNNVWQEKAITCENKKDLTVLWLGLGAIGGVATTIASFIIVSKFTGKSVF